MNPSSWGHTVGLVLELAWIVGIPLAEDGLAKELGMKSSNSIDSVSTHDRHVGHADLLLSRLLDERHARDLVIVTWVLLLKVLNMEMVHKVDQFHVTWKKVLDEGDGPLLQSLWQNGMVGVGIGVLDDAPCLVIWHLLFVQEDSQKLNDGDGRMCIVKLDLVFLSELGPVIWMVLLISSDDVTDGGTAEEVLLLQTELLSCLSVVIWVQHTSDILCLLSLLDSTEVVSLVE